MLAGLLLAPPVATAAPSGAQKPETALEKQIRRVLNAKGPAIDACVKRYLVEYPEAKGTAQLKLAIDDEGKVPKAEVSTKLTGARNLRPCLERVGESLQFPKPERKGGGGDITLTIPVEQGAEFEIPPPGAKREAQKKRPSGFMRFVPNNWAPYGPRDDEGAE